VKSAAFWGINLCYAHCGGITMAIPNEPKTDHTEILFSLARFCLAILSILSQKILSFLVRSERDAQCHMPAKPAEACWELIVINYHIMAITHK